MKKPTDTQLEKIKKLEKISKYLRMSSLEVILKANSGHIGGNLSSVELLTALYFGGYFNFDPTNDKNLNRDQVLIRGHEGPLRYSIFALLGYIDKEELSTYRTFGSRLQGHEDMHICPGVDITPSGSLGMLLSYGVGASISNKEQNINSKTIVFLGDGEEQEGNVSEAARNAAKMRLDNLICILDQNKKQLSRPTEYSDGATDLKKVWEGYGWNVIEISNGNNIEEVLGAYEKLTNITKPTIVIASTTKGLGVPGANNHFSGYHTLSAVPDKQIAEEAYHNMKEQLSQENITFDEIKQLALSLVKRPDQNAELPEYIDNNIYHLEPPASGINLEDAKENYILELKKRILSSDKKSNLYFVTPDLMRTDIVNQVEFNKFTNYIDTGIREQHAIAMCHGISTCNPDARIYVCYGDAFVYRALDQINAASTGKSNIMIVGENAGIFQAQNGKTHQSVGQPSALMSIPELTFYEPADAVDLYNVMNTCLTKNNGVSYIRTHRGTVNLERNPSDLNNTSAYYIHEPYNNPQLYLITMGYPGENTVKAAKELATEYGIHANVINVVNPQQLTNYLPYLITNDAPIITIYNGHPKTLSQIVSEAILTNENLPKAKYIYGLGYIEGTSATVSDLIKHYGFDSQGIKRMVLKRINK